MALVSRIQLVGNSAAARELERSVTSAVTTAAKHAIATEVTAGAEMAATAVTTGTEELLGLPTTAPSTTAPPAAGASEASEPGAHESLGTVLKHAATELREDIGKALGQEVKTLEQEAGQLVAQEVKTLGQEATVAVERSIGLPDVTGSSGTGSATATLAGTESGALSRAVAAATAGLEHAATQAGAAPAAGKRLLGKQANGRESAPKGTAKAATRETAGKSGRPESHETAVAHAAQADATAAEVDTVTQAASAPVMPASPWAIMVAFGVVGASVIAAWLMPHAKPIEIGSTMATYGALLVFATAVERVLEPFSHWLPGRKARERYESAVVKIMNGHPRGSLHEVAHAHSAVLRASADRTVLSWALATAIATIAATASGFYLLRMVSQTNWHATVPTWVDACITGLVVGSGTKPLHDLISRAQSSKDPTPTASS